MQNQLNSVVNETVLIQLKVKNLELILKLYIHMHWSYRVAQNN